MLIQQLLSLTGSCINAARICYHPRQRQATIQDQDNETGALVRRTKKALQRQLEGLPIAFRATRASGHVSCSSTLDLLQPISGLRAENLRLSPWIFLSNTALRHSQNRSSASFLWSFLTAPDWRWQFCVNMPAPRPGNACFPIERWAAFCADRRRRSRATSANFVRTGSL